MLLGLTLKNILVFYRNSDSNTTNEIISFRKLSKIIYGFEDLIVCTFFGNSVKYFSHPQGVTLRSFRMKQAVEVGDGWT